MKILRTAIVAAGVAATMLSSTTPASAATAAAFEGNATIGCFGCGTYGPAGNSATFSVNGTYNGQTGVGIGGSAEFTVDEPTGVTCVVSGSASGKIKVGASAEAQFDWSRTGPYAIITVEGGITASAVFKVTSPVGNPCGGPVSATFAGTASGV